MTRSLLVLALLTVLAAPVLAQDTFTWEPHTLINTVEFADLEAIFGIDLINTTDQQRVYMLEFLDDTPNAAEWSRSWCTHGFCYAPFFQVVPDTLAANTADEDCHMQLGWVFTYPDPVDTTLYINTRVYDEEFPDDYIDNTFILIIGNGSSVDEDESAQPQQYSLAPVYPNPFNAQATVSYTLPAPGDATIALYDVMGREVTTLLHGFQPAGQHQLSLDATTLASGTYLLRMQAGEQQFAQRVTLVK